MDELGAHLGAALVYLGNDPLAAQVRELQNDLFILACDLASPGSAQVPRITAEHTRRLEAWIDQGVDEVGPLEEFVLRGGGPAGAALHLACTVCRRAERQGFRLEAVEPVHPETLIYLNRLGDLLFVMARVANRRAGVGEARADFRRSPA